MVYVKGKDYGICKRKRGSSSLDDKKLGLAKEGYAELVRDKNAVEKTPAEVSVVEVRRLPLRWFYPFHPSSLALSISISLDSAHFTRSLSLSRSH